MTMTPEERAQVVREAREACAQMLDAFGCSEACGALHDASCYRLLAARMREWPASVRYLSVKCQKCKNEHTVVLANERGDAGFMQLASCERCGAYAWQVSETAAPK
jgi:hypothetical protein